MQTMARAFLLAGLTLGFGCSPTRSDERLPSKSFGPVGADGCAWRTGHSAATPGAPVLGATVADLTGEELEGLFLPENVKRKNVPVTGTNTLPGLVVGGGIFVESYTGLTMLFIPVQNTGAETWCLIQGTNYHWLSATGSFVRPGDSEASAYTFVEGSVGELGFGLGASSSCLFPGDTGYVFDLESTPAGSTTRLFDQVASVAVDFVKPPSAGTPTLGRLVPTAYDIGRCSGVEAYRVHVQNQGTDEVILETSTNATMVFLLADDGTPVDVDFLHVDAFNFLAPGGTDVMRPLTSLGVATTHLRVYASYDVISRSADTDPLAFDDADVIENARRLRAERYARWRASTSAAR